MMEEEKNGGNAVAGKFMGTHKIGDLVKVESRGNEK